MYSGVPRLSPDSVSASEPAAVTRLGDPEIRHHRVAILQEDVRRLDIPVDHAVAVGVVEGVGHLARDPQGIIERQLLLARQPVRRDSPSTKGMT